MGAHTLSVSGEVLLRGGFGGHGEFGGFGGLDGLGGLDGGYGGGSSVGGGKVSAGWGTSRSGDGFDGYGFVGVVVGNIDEVGVEVEGGMDPGMEDTKGNPLDMGEGVVDMDVGVDGVDVCGDGVDVVVVVVVGVGVPVPVSVGEVVAAGRFPCAECGNRSCGAEVPLKGRMSKEKRNVCARGREIGEKREEEEMDGWMDGWIWWTEEAIEIVKKRKN